MKGDCIMSKLLLSQSTMQDIEKRVDRVLKEIGNPAPPIPHVMIREALRLDMAYFQKDDPGIISEVWSRLKRGTKQILQRPSILKDMIESRSLRAAYSPDIKRIYVDGELHPFKKRWGETHECVHGLLPWHQNYMMGDDKHTLTQVCREKLEAEANYGTGRLLFAGNRFTEELADLPCSIRTAADLSKSYKNSLTSTLWWIVESSDDMPVLAYICPNHSPDGLYATPGAESDTHFVKSALFSAQFSNIQDGEVNKILNSYVRPNARYFAGEKAEILRDVNGNPHVFHFETINNRYSYLTLATVAPF